MQSQGMVPIDITFLETMRAASKENIEKLISSEKLKDDIELKQLVVKRKLHH